MSVRSEKVSISGDTNSETTFDDGKKGEPNNVFGGSIRGTNTDRVC